MNEIQKAIMVWGEKVVAKYKAIALNPANKANYGVYTQSDLTRIVCKPHLMIIGINPGSGKNDKPREYYTSLTAESFLKGNVCWDDRNKWKFWRDIKSFMATLPDFVDDSSQTVMTNLTCFATKKLSQLNQYALRETAPLTMDLIKILSPELIVMLSRNVLSIIENINNESGMLGSVKCENIYDNICMGTINEIPMVCVPHPNTRPTVEEKRLYQEVIRLAAIGTSPKQVRESCSEELIPNVERRKAERLQHKNDIAKFAETVVELIINSGLHVYEENKQTKRFDFPNRLQITITTCSNGYIAVRLKEHPNKFDYLTQIWDNMDIHKLIILDKYRWNKGNAWIGIKPFSLFSSTGDAIKEIMAIYKELDIL